MSSVEELVHQALNESVSLKIQAHEYATYVQTHISQRKNQIKKFKELKLREQSAEEIRKIEYHIQSTEDSMRGLQSNFHLAMCYETKRELIILLARALRKKEAKVSELTMLRTLSQDPLVNEVIFEISQNVVENIFISEEEADPRRAPKFPTEDEMGEDYDGEELPKTPIRQEWLETQNAVRDKMYEALELTDFRENLREHGFLSDEDL